MPNILYINELTYKRLLRTATSISGLHFYLKKHGYSYGSLPVFVQRWENHEIETNEIVHLIERLYRVYFIDEPFDSNLFRFYEDGYYYQTYLEWIGIPNNTIVKTSDNNICISPVEPNAYTLYKVLDDNGNFVNWYWKIMK